MARVKMHCRQRRRDSRVPGFVCRYTGGGEAVVDALGVLGGGGGGVVALRWGYPILLLRLLRVIGDFISHSLQHSKSPFFRSRCCLYVSCGRSTSERLFSFLHLGLALMTQSRVPI